MEVLNGLGLEGARLLGFRMDSYDELDPVGILVLLLFSLLE